MIEYRVETTVPNFYTTPCRETAIRTIIRPKINAQILIHSEQLINRKHIIKNNYYFNLVREYFSDIFTIEDFSTQPNGRLYLSTRVDTSQPFELKTSLCLFILTRDFNSKIRNDLIKEILENYDAWFSRDGRRYRNAFLTAFTLYLIFVKKSYQELDLNLLPVEGIRSFGSKSEDRYKYLWPLVQEFSSKYDVHLPDISSDFTGDRITFS